MQMDVENGYVYDNLRISEVTVNNDIVNAVICDCGTTIKIVTESVYY